MVELRQSVATRYGAPSRVVTVPPEVPAGDLSITIGSYPSVEAAYIAVCDKGIPVVRLWSPDTTPVRMMHANDTRGMSWCS